MDLSTMNYSDFCLYLTECKTDISYVLEYDDWSVIYVDGKFIYYEHEIEGSSDEFFEVLPIASLTYDITDTERVDKLLNLANKTNPLDCDVCGEEVLDDRINYWWFKKK